MLEAKCLKLPQDSEAMYTNYNHIPSITDEKVNTLEFGWDHLVSFIVAVRSLS